MSFRHVHASGLWDGSAATWATAVRAATSRASVVTFTETTLRKPARKGWTACHGGPRPGENESTVLWKDAEWEPVAKGWAEPIAKTRFALGSGKERPPTHALVQPLRHKRSGREVVFVVVHFPSAVEGVSRLVRGARRAATYVEALAGLVALRRRLRKRFPKAAFVLAADTNLDHRKAWVRAFLKAGLPGFRSGWRRLPKGGTHGKRVIDAVRFTRRLATRGSTVLARPKGFDHAPILTVYTFRKARRSKR